MLRYVLWFIAGLATTPAWADGTGGVDPTSLSAWAGFLKDGGPWAFLVIAGYVIWSQKAENRDLYKSLVTATGKAEAVAGAVTNALSSLEGALKRTDERVDERWNAVKDMSEDLGRVATLVGSNGQSITDLKASLAETLRDLKAAVEGLRGEIAGLYRRPH